MKTIINSTRVIVGLLFIFSGLVKANDPLGLSYKMEEFFELWNITQLNQHSLWLSVAIIAFEIIAGFALLLGWGMKLFSWLLLLLIVFFSFLTGYAYLSGKFKNCGCFGDCIPISPFASFIKDLILLMLILLLFIFRNKIKPVFGQKASIPIMLLVVAAAFGVQFYALKHLPFVDCLPFKKGNNISEKMKIPANAVPDSIVITFIYEKQGKEIAFTADNFPADFNDSLYILKNRIDKIVRKGKNNEPPIKGFSLITPENIDSTEALLQKSGNIILLFINIQDNEVDSKLAGFLKFCSEKGIPVYMATSDVEKLKTRALKAGWNYSIFKIDFTAFRTAARANPTIYLLNKGSIIHKWSLADRDDAINYLNASYPR